MGGIFEKLAHGLMVCDVTNTDLVHIDKSDAEMILRLLKEQEEQKQKWLQTIADNQLDIGGADPLTEYEQGKWDGLQIAFEILTE